MSVQGSCYEYCSHLSKESEVLISYVQTLLQLIPPRQSAVQDRVKEVLDVDLIRQQAAHGILDIGGYADFVVSILLRLCAPSRDSDIQSLLLYKDDVVELFK